MLEKLWMIWKAPVSRRRFIIGELSKNKNIYCFKYINPELEDAKENGFSYFPGFNDLSKTYTSNTLFKNIETRLPNPSRPDYLEILNLYDLETDSNQMEILRATKGRLLTDNFEFVPPFDRNKIEFDIAGTSHHLLDEEVRKVLRINDNLELEQEPDNKEDRYAIKVLYEIGDKRVLLGYVPRYYSKDLTDLLDKGTKYSAKIESLKLDSEISDEDVTASVKLIFENK